MREEGSEPDAKEKENEQVDLEFSDELIKFGWTLRGSEFD